MILDSGLLFWATLYSISVYKMNITSWQLIEHVIIYHKTDNIFSKTVLHTKSH